jgi:anti-sigma regulatory factor (Ser/Thr protein kinase)
MRVLALTASLDRLREIQNFLAAAIPEEFASVTPRIELIVEEFLVNAVKHAYGGQPGPLEVSLREVVFDGQPHLALKVVDWGPPFNPFTEAKPADLSLDLEDRPIGGLGIHLIRSAASHTSYFRAMGANTAEVWIQSPEPAPAG